MADGQLAPIRLMLSLGLFVLQQVHCRLLMLLIADCGQCDSAPDAVTNSQRVWPVRATSGRSPGPHWEANSVLLYSVRRARGDCADIWHN